MGQVGQVGNGISTALTKQTLNQMTSNNGFKNFVFIKKNYTCTQSLEHGYLHVTT